MSHYSWPGNVRELENVIEQASAFCDGQVLEETHLPLDLARPVMTAGICTGTIGTSPAIEGTTLEDVEKLAIQQTLGLCKGNKAAAARHLGITEKSIDNKMGRLGLP